MEDLFNILIPLLIIIFAMFGNIAQKKKQQRRAPEGEPEGEDGSFEDIFGPFGRAEKETATPEQLPPAEVDESMRKRVGVRKLAETLKRSVAVMEEDVPRPVARARRAREAVISEQAHRTVLQPLKSASSFLSPDPAALLLEDDRYTSRQKLFIISSVLGERGGHKPAGGFRP